MADAGGVVYLLSSYQSGKERRGHWEGERGEREIYRRKGKTKGNTLFQQKQQLLLCAAAWTYATFSSARIHGSSSTLVMWEINDWTRLSERPTAYRGMSQYDHQLMWKLHFPSFSSPTQQVAHIMQVHLRVSALIFYLRQYFSFIEALRCVWLWITSAGSTAAWTTAGRWRRKKREAHTHTHTGKNTQVHTHTNRRNCFF